MNKEKLLIWIKIAGLLIAGIGLIGCFLSNYGHVKFSSMKEAIPLSGKNLLSGKNDFKVAVFGDFAMQNGVVEPVMQDISKTDAAFAICTGDIFRHPGEGAAFYLRQIFDKNLQKPYCCVPGNHDLSEDGKKSLVYYRIFHGPEQYYFSCGDTLFILLNTADYEFDSERVQYLKNILAKFRKDYRRCILVAHIPPTEPDENGDYHNKPFKKELSAIVKQYDITGIVCGHLHIAQTLKFGDVPVYISHTSGQSNRDKENPYYGYLILHFKADGTVQEEFIFKPELKRSRNYFYGFILEKVYGSTVWLVLSLVLFLSGIAVFCAACYMKTKKAENDAGACS